MENGAQKSMKMHIQQQRTLELPDPTPTRAPFSCTCVLHALGNFHPCFPLLAPPWQNPGSATVGHELIQPLKSIGKREKMRKRKKNEGKEKANQKIIDKKIPSENLFTFFSLS